MSNDRATGDRTADHVDELPDGAGCTEIWEHLAERRTDDEPSERECTSKPAAGER